MLGQSASVFRATFIFCEQQFHKKSAMSRATPIVAIRALGVLGVLRVKRLLTMPPAAQIVASDALKKLLTMPPHDGSPDQRSDSSASTRVRSALTSAASEASDATDGADAASVGVYDAAGVLG